MGRSIARELIGNGHQVLLIDRDPASLKPERVPDAEWLLADSCELSSLEEARLEPESWAARKLAWAPATPDPDGMQMLSLVIREQLREAV